MIRLTTVKIKPPTVYPTPVYRVKTESGKEAATVYRTSARTWHLECALFDYGVTASRLQEALEALRLEMERRGYE